MMMNGETVDIPEKYQHLFKKYYYAKMFDHELPFSLTIEAFMYDSMTKQRIELKDLLDPDQYLISDIEYEGDNTGNRFIFSLLFSVYSGNDIDKIKKFTDLFVMDDDFVFAKKSTDIFLSLIATAMNTSNIENVMDVFPDIDYDRLLDHNWISTFIDETYKAIDTIFDVLNDNEDSVFWELIQYYDMLGNLLHYHDMCTLKLDGPFYINENNKENMFYIQQCSLGPVWYFEKGFKLNKKGDK